MNMLNSIILEGDITKVGTLECQFTDVPQITAVIAVERTFRGSKGDTISEVSEFEIIAYGKTAEFLSKKGVKGQGIRVVGRLKQFKWLDGEKECSRVVVVAEHIEYKPLKKKEAKDEK